MKKCPGTDKESSKAFRGEVGKMNIGNFANAIAARDLQMVQSQVSIKVIRMALDAQASSAAALLAAENMAAGVGQNLNTLG